VLADWILSMAEAGGFIAQMTSVPGVAQRTGATIYYLELFPQTAVPEGSPAPVLALMPVPGDVDVVVCSELMEAGRAVQRGFVTPDRTTLVASTHRVYSMAERTALADGRVDRAALLQACETAAKRLVAADLAAVAERTGSVVSAALFGALARSGALPFERAAFERTIERGGVGVGGSLRAFEAAWEAVGDEDAAPTPPPSALPPPTLDGRDTDQTTRVRPDDADPAKAPALVAEVERRFPEAARAIAREGVSRCAGFQDETYARLYLRRLEPILTLDGDGRLLAETARQLALGMAYEDTIRVAELKTKAERFARVRDEVKLGQGQVLEIAEFLHPRVQEIAETLPASFGRRLLRTPWALRIVGRFAAKGRVVRTSTVRGFLLLAAVAALKPLRPRTLRWENEQAFLDNWLRLVADAAKRDRDLAVEVAGLRNLVKGYGDTHARGLAAFERIVALLPVVEARPEPAQTVAALHKAALADDTGAALDEAATGLTLSHAADVRAFGHGRAAPSPARPGVTSMAPIRRCPVPLSCLKGWPLKGRSMRCGRDQRSRARL
jgi:indolepyruvate ferredoxin oxidoreductase beta subunit